MKLMPLTACGMLALLACVSGCATQNPTSPTGTTAASTATTTNSVASVTTITDQRTGVTIASPRPVSPLNNVQILYASQPITLVVTNGFSTGGFTRTYTFEVASDSAFSSIVASKSGVAEGSGGQTSLTLDKLAGKATYYWRVRVTTNGLDGPNSTPWAFVVGPPVTIATPVLAAPGANATVSATPTLTTNNAVVTGPAQAIFYRFDVADSSSFANIVFTATVAQQSGATTSTTVTTTLRAGITYWWRVLASDPGDGITTAYSIANPFSVIVFDWKSVTMISSPYDFPSWAETAHVTSVVFTPISFQVDFDRRDGPNRWPDAPFGSGSIEYTLGMCGDLNHDGHWYCSAVVQFWYGRELDASTPPWNVATAWFYDPARWGPMTGYQPQDGETVALFVCQGNCRNDTSGIGSTVHERSDAALVPWNNEGGTSYSFGVAKAPLQVVVKH